LAAEAAAERPGQGLRLIEAAALGIAARGHMAERMVFWAKARIRTARAAARHLPIVGPREDEGTAGILAIMLSHSIPLAIRPCYSSIADIY
jgi:hypothetical protein